MQSIQEKWWNMSETERNCDNDLDDSISAGNLAGTFILVLCGVVLSFVVMALEFIYYKFIYPIRT